MIPIALLGVAGCTGAPSTRDAPASASGAEIVLPEMLAVELPGPDVAELAPGDSPLRELLEAASARGLAVTHDLTRPVGAGAHDITWTAWAGTQGQSAARGTRSARIYVFPFGQTPAGLSGDDRATVGNQSPKVVRDAWGRAHMVWLDSNRPGRGIRVMYRRAAADPTTGAVAWETEAIRVGDQDSEVWNSYPVIEASANAVHVAWAGPRTVRYRRLVRAGDTWAFEPIRDTRVPGPGEDWAPGLAARGDGEVHLLTPTGGYAVSADGGRTWTADRVPVPPGTALKGPALAVDPRGNSHVTFIGLVRSPAGGFTSYGKQHGAYWTLRYVRRRAGGGWEDAQDALAGYPEWRDPGTRDDLLVDFADVAVDGRGNIHLAWHGSANTRAYSYDEAFYMQRAPTGPDRWGPWTSIQPLHPLAPAQGDHFSFAPSLSVDEPSGAVLAALFVDTVPAVGKRFDAVARVLRDGRLDGPPIRLTRAARDAVGSGHPERAWSTWFPVAAPRVFRSADGRAWLDVLETVVTTPDAQAAHYVVYQRLDVTALLGQRP
jgi:hypothetical protein